MTLKWDRRLWGVKLDGLRSSDPPLMLGRAWARDLGGEPHQYEPTRPLLFCTRRKAREWCAAKNSEWQTQTDSIVRNWHVRPVRVRELVEELQC